MRRAFLWLVLAGTTLTACGAERGARPKNLLIVCIDTLRADQTGFLGAKPSLTPSLDRLAQRGVVFEQAHAAASWTLPSVGALFTSSYPSTTKLWTFDSRLSGAFTTLAELFQAAGFETQGIASHVFFDGDYGLQQGFAAFDAELAHRKGEEGWREVTSPEVSGRAIQWLEQRADEKSGAPWLLFLHFFDPHLPYVDHRDPPQPGASEFERYTSEVAFADAHVGAVLYALERAGFADDTVVLFFSDHGESFFEHPGIQRHSFSLYEQELHVPLVLAVPGIAPRRVAAEVRTVDLLPTLLELFGLHDTAPARAGTSLVPLLTGGEPPGAANLAEIRLKDGHHANALVSGRWKLIEDVSGSRFELYDLEADPGETTNLASARPEIVAELRQALRVEIAAAEARGQAFAPAEAVPKTPEELERLKELGYGGDEETPKQKEGE